MCSGSSSPEETLHLLDFYSPRPFWVSQDGVACCGTLLLGGTCMLHRTMCKLSPFSPWSADCRKLPHEAVGAGWEREGKVAGGNPQQKAQMARASLLPGRTVMNRNPPRGWKFEQASGCSLGAESSQRLLYNPWDVAGGTVGWLGSWPED